MIILRRLLADRRRSLLWWSLGILLTNGLTVALWPSIRGQEQFDEVVRDLPEALRALIGAQEDVAFTSPPGYLHTRLFSSVLPVLLLVFGIAAGARAVGGAEEDGTIQLPLAHPVSRLRFALERGGAVVLMVVGLAVLSVASLLLMAPPVDLLEGVSLTRVAGAGVALLALALLHTGIAFGAGAAWGRRGTAQAVAGAVAVGGYLLQGLIAVSDAARPARFVSPWHWFLERNLLIHAPSPQATVLPAALALAFGGVGVWRFRRRDLRLP